MRMGVPRGAGESQEDFQHPAHQGLGLGQPVGGLQGLRRVDTPRIGRLVGGKMAEK